MEELKMVMDSIATLGGDAKTTFITWLIVRYVIQGIIIGGSVVGGLIILSKLVVKVLNVVTFSARLCEEVGRDWLSPTAKRNIMDAIRRGKEIAV